MPKRGSKGAATLSEDQLHDVAVETAQVMALQRGIRSPWDRTIQAIVGVIAIVSLIFSLGVNWSRLTTLETKQIEQENRLTAAASAISVQEKNSAVVQAKLDNLKEQLGNLQRDIATISGKLDRR